MNALLSAMVTGHLTLWAVPAVVAILCSALGRHVPKPALVATAAVGVVVPLVQSLGSALLLMLGAVSEPETMRLSTVEGAGRFVLALRPDAVGCWAAALASFLCLGALVQALQVAGAWIGRHRYFALLLLLLASANLLFVSASMIVFIFAWEAVALSGAFLAGFWEAEVGRERTGMRWLVFQHVSTVCLVVAWLISEVAPSVAAAFAVSALALRFGLVPVHGWIAEQSNAPSSAMVAVQAVASVLAGLVAVHKLFPLVRQGELDFRTLLAGLSMVTVVAAAISAWPRQRLSRSLAMLIAGYGAMAVVMFLSGDPVAARMWLTGALPPVSAAVLGMVGLAGTLDKGAFGMGQAARKVLALSLAVATVSLSLFPGLAAMALGRYVAGCGGDWLGWGGRLVALVLLLATGRVLSIMARASLETYGDEANLDYTGARWLKIVVMVLVASGFLLGLALLVSHGMDPTVYGGLAGAAWASSGFVAMLAGWAAGWYGGGRGVTTAYLRNLLERAGRGGAGLGEIVVALPLLLLRTAGTIVWRVVGDFLIDTVMIGAAVAIVQGTGGVIRFLHNGKVQRYLFLLVATALLVMLLMGR